MWLCFCNVILHYKNMLYFMYVLLLYTDTQILISLHPHSVLHRAKGQVGRIESTKDNQSASNIFPKYS